MFTWRASWKVVAPMPNSFAVTRSLKTLLPAASDTSKTISSPAMGWREQRFSARARRCMVWPGWYRGLSVVSRIRASRSTATSGRGEVAPVVVVELDEEPGGALEARGHLDLGRQGAQLVREALADDHALAVRELHLDAHGGLGDRGTRRGVAGEDPYEALVAHGVFVGGQDLQLDLVGGLEQRAAACDGLPRAAEVEFVVEDVGGQIGHLGVVGEPGELERDRVPAHHPEGAELAVDLGPVEVAQHELERAPQRRVARVEQRHVDEDAFGPPTALDPTLVEQRRDRRNPRAVAVPAGDALQVLADEGRIGRVLRPVERQALLLGVVRAGRLESAARIAGREREEDEDEEQDAPVHDRLLAHGGKFGSGFYHQSSQRQDPCQLQARERQRQAPVFTRISRNRRKTGRRPSGQAGTTCAKSSHGRDGQTSAPRGALTPRAPLAPPPRRLTGEDGLPSLPAVFSFCWHPCG